MERGQQVVRKRYKTAKSFPITCACVKSISRKYQLLAAGSRFPAGPDSTHAQGNPLLQFWCRDPMSICWAYKNNTS